MPEAKDGQLDQDVEDRMVQFASWTEVNEPKNYRRLSSIRLSSADRVSGESLQSSSGICKSAHTISLQRLYGAIA